MVYLTLITSLAIAGTAAWYSIVGLMAIFAGAVIPIAIMGAVLEVGKLVTAAWLHQNWKKTSLWMKSYLTSAVFLLMVITSLGIFGFLSKAHLEHSIETGGTNELQIENLERRVATQQRSITDAETVLSQLDTSVQILLDADRVRGNSGAIAVRKAQAEERTTLNEEIDNALATIEKLSGQLTYAKNKQLAIEVEVGPLKYIAELMYGDTAEDYFDEAVRAVIILIIITFDPLAIVLLLAATQGFSQRKQDKMRIFNPDNVADIENNFDIVDVDMEKYTIVEEGIPEGDDIQEYEVVREDPDDPTDPVRKQQWDRGEWNQNL